jgi:hypothetical protein
VGWVEGWVVGGRVMLRGCSVARREEEEKE